MAATLFDNLKGPVFISLRKAKEFLDHRTEDSFHSNMQFRD